MVVNKKPKMASKLKFPLFSVIIPTYNSEKYLISTIESVLNQTYPNIEIIVIDDGSDDASKKVLNSYLNKIQYHVIPHSGLPSVVRNFGISIAKGEFIAFLDSDDIWLPEKIYKQHCIFKEHPQLELVATNAIRFYDLNDTNREKVPPENELFLNQYSTGFYPFDVLLCNNLVITSSVVITRECIIKNGYFSEDLKFRAIEDYHLWLRIALSNDIYYTEEPLLKYRDRLDSIRSEQSTIINYERMILVFSDILDRVKHSTSFKRREIWKIRRQKMFITIELFKYCILNKHFISICHFGLIFITKKLKFRPHIFV